VKAPGNSELGETAAQGVTCALRNVPSSSIHLHERERHNAFRPKRSAYELTRPHDGSSRALTADRLLSDFRGTVSSCRATRFVKGPDSGRCCRRPTRLGVTKQAGPDLALFEAALEGRVRTPMQSLGELALRGDRGSTSSSSIARMSKALGCSRLAQHGGGSRRISPQETAMVDPVPWCREWECGIKRALNMHLKYV